MNKKYNNIDVSEKLDLAIKGGIRKAKKSKRNRIIVAVASICIFSVSIFGVVNPAIAENIPIASNIFEYLNSKANFKESYTKGSQYKYSEAVNQTVKDNGIELTMNEAYCDGINTFITYTLKSDKKIDENCSNIDFLEIKTCVEGIDDNVPLYYDSAHGKLYDDNTYVGMMVFKLGDKAIKKVNSDGYLNVKFNFSKIFIDDEKSHVNFFTTKYGNWNFGLKMSMDSNNIREFHPNITDNGFTLDKLIITPASTVVEFSSSSKDFPDGTLVEGIDNNHNYIEFLQGGNVSEDSRKQRWELSNIDENAKTLKIRLFDKNKNDGEKIAEFVFDIK